MWHFKKRLLYISPACQVTFRSFLQSCFFTSGFGVVASCMEGMPETIKHVKCDIDIQILANIALLQFKN